MLSALHHFVREQLMLSVKGAYPGGYSWSSMNAEPAAFGSVADPELLSLSGVHGFWG